jgi:hypothetical protein
MCALRPSRRPKEWWQQHDERVYECIKLWVEQWWESQRHVLTDAVGEVFGQHRASVREAITKLKERVIRLETATDLKNVSIGSPARSSVGP